MSSAPISQRIRFSRRLSGIRLVESAQSTTKRPAAPPQQAADALSQQSASIERLLTKIHDQVAVIVQDEKRNQLELQQAAIELAVAAADCLASRCVELGKYSVQGMIAQAVEMSAETDSVLVILNPADHELFKNLPGDEVAAFSNLSIQTDPRISKGECRIQTSSERLSFGIANRLESIRRVWMETLDDAAA